MNKLKELLSNLDVPTVLLCLYIVKCMALGTNIAEALVALGLTGLYGYKMFQNKREVVRREQLDKEIQEIKAELTGMKMGLNMKKAHDVQQKKDKRYF